MRTIPRTVEVTIALGLLAGLLLLSGCTRGQDPWDTTGWRSRSFDYETDFWEPVEPPCPAPCAPAVRPTPRAVPQPAPVWTPPAGPGRQAVPSGPAVPPPPPPPPYPLPR